MKYEKFLSGVNRIAVVGATGIRQKYGWRVLMSLHKAGINVVGVNPKYVQIVDVLCFPNLYNIPEKPDLVVTVVPPQITEQVVAECEKQGIQKIWIQPGSESTEAITKAKQAGLDVVSNACIVVDGYGLSLVI